jgi:site-specific DNA-methyltransferase (adenine-specific)
LRDRNFDGSCQVTTVRGGLSSETQERRLDEFDVFVRDSNAVSILQKVLALEEPSVNTILARDKEFGWTSNFDGFRARKMVGDVPLHYIRAGKRSVGYIPREAVLKSGHLIDLWKVMVPKAGSDGGQRIPDVVLGKPLIASSPSVCTQSFLFFYCETKEQARSITSYYQTKFFRFLVSLRKMTQDATHSTYTWVPLQSWDFDWTDEMLYSKYSLTDEERSYIEQVIRPMDVDLFGGLLDE